MNASTLGFIIFLTAVTTLPVKMTAEFVGAKNKTLRHSAICVTTSTAIMLLMFYFFSHTVESYLISFVLVVLVFKNVLIPPPGFILWLAILAIAIQLGVISAMASYGKFSGNHFFLMIS